MHISQKTCRNGSTGPLATTTGKPTNYLRTMAMTALALAASLSVAGCAKDGSPLANLQTPLSQTSNANGQSSAAAVAVIAKARELQKAGNPRTAAQMLSKAFAKAPKDEELRRAYAIAALEAGDAQLAYKLTSPKHVPSNSDARQLSVRGAALSTLGQHDRAEQAFASALALSPNDPTLINNLAMALTMKGNAKKAETLLRRTAGTAKSDRTRHNLALVVGLQGRLAEAKKVALTIPEPEAARESAPSTKSETSPTAKKSSWTGTVKASLGGPKPID